MRYRDLVEPELTGQRGSGAFVLRMPPAVQEHDGERAPAGTARAGELDPQLPLIEGGQHLAARIDALARLDHAGVKE